MSDAVELHDRVDGIAGEWDELVDRSGASTFMRPGWYAAWWRAFGRGRLEIVALRRGGALVGVCPLARRAGTLRAPVNWHTPVWHPVAEDDAALETLVAAVASAARPRLSVGFLDAGTPGHDALLAAVSRPRWRARAYELESSPYIELAGESWEAREERLGAKRRSNLRRLWRRLEERGALEFAVHDGREQLDALLDEGLDLEASGWKGEGGTAIRSDPATSGFYRDVAHWAAARGSLALAFLRLDGRAIAFDFAIEEHGIHSLLKTAYDEPLRSSAPGLQLRTRMIERAHRRGLSRYEFLGDALPWKLEWTDTVHARVGIDAFAPGAAGGAGWIAWAYARPALRRLRALRP